MADENPHQFSTQTTGVTFAQITDNTDFPHTGLIKALSLMAKGNMAVKGSATDFDITQASSGNVIQVAAGRIFKDNKLTAQVVAKNFTSSSFNTSSSGSHYHLLVVQSSDNTLQIRKQSDATVADKVPEYTEGDTIIAVIIFNSSTAALGSMQIQFLTTGKTENSLSVGRDNSGYTESLSVVSNVGNVEIESKEEDKDIIFKVNDGGVSTEVMRIDGATSYIGIGTDSPATLLHIKSSGTGEPKITIENTNADAQEPQLEFKKNGISPANSDDLGIIRFVGDDSNGSAHLYSYIMADSESVTAGAENGRIFFFNSKAGATNEVIGISHDEIVINEAGVDTNFRVEGDSEANLLFVDAGLDKVGIGTTTINQKLTVSGSIGAGGFVGSVVEVTGSPASAILNISAETHRTIIADTQTFGPAGPTGGPLALTLPAASGNHQGFEFRIIAKNSAAGADALTLNVSGSSDLIIDATGATIGNASAGFTLVTGKVYTVIHVNSTMYMALLLN